MSGEWTQAFISLSNETKAGTGFVEGSVVDLRQILGTHAVHYYANRTPGAEFTIAVQGSIPGSADWVDLAVISSGASDPNTIRGMVVVHDCPSKTLRAVLTVTVAGSSSVSGVNATLTSSE